MHVCVCAACFGRPTRDGGWPCVGRARLLSLVLPVGEARHGMAAVVSSDLSPLLEAVVSSHLWWVLAAVVSSDFALLAPPPGLLAAVRSDLL